MSPTTTMSRRYRALLDPLAYYDKVETFNPAPAPGEPYFTGGDRRDAPLPHEYWKQQHNFAIQGPRENERGIRDLILGWLTYADQYETQFGFPNPCYGDAEEPCADCDATRTRQMREWPADEQDNAYEEAKSYCDHCEQCHGWIGDDYVLGDAWGKIGQQLLILLNGDLGRLDGGTLNSCIHAAFRLAGLDENGE